MPADDTGGSDRISWSHTGSRIFQLVLWGVRHGMTGMHTPVVGDWNGDKCADILWDAPGDSEDEIWLGSPTQSFGKVGASFDQDLVPVAGRFDADAPADIFWYRKLAR